MYFLLIIIHLLWVLLLLLNIVIWIYNHFAHCQTAKGVMEESPDSSLQLNFDMWWKKKSLDRTCHLISLFLFYFWSTMIDKVFRNRKDPMLRKLDQDQPLNLEFQLLCEVKLKYHPTMSIPHDRQELKFNLIYNLLKAILFIIFFLKYEKLVFYFPFKF